MYSKLHLPYRNGDVLIWKMTIFVKQNISFHPTISSLNAVVSCSNANILCNATTHHFFLQKYNCYFFIYPYLPPKYNLLISSYFNNKLLDFPSSSKIFSHVFKGFQIQAPLPFPFCKSKVILLTSCFIAEYSTITMSLLCLFARSFRLSRKSSVYRAVLGNKIVQSHQNAHLSLACYQ